jgi:hypothetical protein
LLPSCGEADEPRGTELSAARAPRCASTKSGTHNDATINVTIAHNNFIEISRFPNIVARYFEFRRV